MWVFLANFIALEAANGFAAAWRAMREATLRDVVAPTSRKAQDIIQVQRGGKLQLLGFGIST